MFLLLKRYKKATLSTLGILFLFVFSCEKAIPVTGDNNESINYTINYIGKSYEVTYILNGDSYVLQEGKDNKVVQDILEISTSGIALDPQNENIIWVYTNEKELATIDNEFRNRLNSPYTKKRNPLEATHKCTVHQLKNNGGKYRPFGSDMVWYAPDLRDVMWIGGGDMNDAISDIYIWQSTIGAWLFYEDINLNGHSLYGAPGQDWPELWKVKMTLFSSWDNKISSLKAYGL